MIFDWLIPDVMMTSQQNDDVTDTRQNTSCPKLIRTQYLCQVSFFGDGAFWWSVQSGTILLSSLMSHHHVSLRMNHHHYFVDFVVLKNYCWRHHLYLLMPDDGCFYGSFRFDPVLVQMGRAHLNYHDRDVRDV